VLYRTTGITMSRPLHLDTHMGHNRRYSFMNTPTEMHSTTQFPDSNYSSPAPASSSPAQEPAIQLAIEHPPQQSEQIAPRFSSNEKERHLQEEGIVPTFSKYPPPDQHPANYAPCVEPHVQQPPESQLVQSPPYLYDHYHQSPSSPGPLPLKINPEAPYRSDTLSIAPDANPLQSPKIPYLPPPTPAPASRVPTVEDLSSYHQPGQIMHPNQEVQGGTWSHGLCDCTNLGTCCHGLICPCMLYGKTQHRLLMKSKKDDPTNMLGYNNCNGSCTAMALLCGCQCKFRTCAVSSRPTYANLRDRAPGYNSAHQNQKGVWNQG
jgi:hypothetical protein